MTENMAARGEGLAGLAREWREMATHEGSEEDLAYKLGMELAAEQHRRTRLTLEKCIADLAALEAAAPPSTAHDELSLVRLVLSAHQTAYAKFHNGEGRGVIEADQMAIGYASVELAKALAMPEQWKIELLSGKGNWSDAVSPHFDTREAAQGRANELAVASGLGVKFRVALARSSSVPVGEQQ